MFRVGIFIVGHPSKIKKNKFFFKGFWGFIFFLFLALIGAKLGLSLALKTGGVRVIYITIFH